MPNLPEDALQWQQFSKDVKRQMSEPQDGVEPLSMLAKWGSEQDNAIRNYGTQKPSPIIDPNTKLNFEQRILNPGKYPRIDNGDGSMSTHRMAWGGSDGKYMSFPTIVQMEDGTLQRLGNEDAFQHAMNTNEYRAFATPEEAQSYSEGGYKKFWGLGEKKK